MYEFEGQQLFAEEVISALAEKSIIYSIYDSDKDIIVIKT